MITLLLLVHAIYTYCCSSRTSRSWWITHSTQHHPLLFTTNCTDRTFFLWRLHTARPPHPGHSTIWCDRKSPSCICAKLCTVAASNNRVHMPRSLYYCLFAPCIHIAVLRAHPVRGESDIQRNVTREVATIPTKILYGLLLTSTKTQNKGYRPTTPIMICNY